MCVSVSHEGKEEQVHQMKKIVKAAAEARKRKELWLRKARQQRNRTVFSFKKRADDTSQTFCLISSGDAKARVKLQDHLDGATERTAKEPQSPTFIYTHLFTWWHFYLQLQKAKRSKTDAFALIGKGKQREREREQEDNPCNAYTAHKLTVRFLS